jgi:hypothetical protein
MRLLWALVLLLPGLDGVAAYPKWRESGSLWILTTPEGADLPATCAEADFPLLVRLRGENFDFARARPDGGDLRFSDSRGQPLPYQIRPRTARGGGHGNQWWRPRHGVSLRW